MGVRDNGGQGMNVTQWFDASVKPVHVGWYETRWTTKGEIELRHWNGDDWYARAYSVGKLIFSSFGCLELTDNQWRGVAK